MKDLHTFLIDNLSEHQKRIKELSQHSKSVAQTLLLSLSADRWWWPYTCTVRENNELKPEYTSPEPSVSTQAMICTSIGRMLRRDRVHRVFDEEQKDELRNRLRDAQHTAQRNLLRFLQRRVYRNPFLKSSTFGKNDVFTASWLLQMYAEEDAWSEKERFWTREIRGALVRAIANAIVRKGSKREITFEQGLFTFAEGRNEAGPHSLPLLKVINALEIIDADPSLRSHWNRRFQNKQPIRKAIELAGDWLEKNLHRQMSFSRFRDFRFDAAELIFCLRGSITTRRITTYESIVENVLDVVSEAQKSSVYWRPYRPMTSSSQGGVLLPLSIEVAMALLQTLTAMKQFSRYEDTLEQYFKWLYSQRLIPSDTKDGEPPRWVGWHSENAYEFKVVHVWDTALVGAFLCELLEAKDSGFQERLLDVGSFTLERPQEKPDRLVPSLDSMIPPDLRLKANATTRRIKRQYVPEQKGGRPKEFSLLVFGPPGSSKTTLARALAKSLEWPLVYLSPSNFTTSGEAGIEQHAKDVFDVLGCLRDKVILFDEIDHLILDRDNPKYATQAAMVQLMTPSMLTKVNNLREAKRCVFLIATNYEELIDNAIKRSGRIDEVIPWLPMDLRARTKQLEDFIDDEFEEMSGEHTSKKTKWSKRLDTSLSKFAGKCALFTYPELKKFFKDTRVHVEGTRHAFRLANVRKLVGLQKDDIPAHDISLENYEQRTKEKAAQGPYLEYAYLLIIQGESGLPAKDRFRGLVQRWEDNTPDDYKKNWPKVEQRLKSYSLSSWKPKKKTR